VPGQPQIEYQLTSTHERNGHESARLAFCIHEGTHIDPPLHYFSDGQSIDEIPVETLIAPGVMCRLGKVKPGQPISLAQFLEAVALPKDPTGHIVIIDSEWDHVTDPGEYYGPNAPHLSRELADWLVASRVRAVGLTNPPDNPEQARRGNAPIHRTLLGGGVLIIENLTNLDSITSSTFTVVAMPLKIHRGCGGPARVVVFDGSWMPE